MRGTEEQNVAEGNSQQPYVGQALGVQETGDHSIKAFSCHHPRLGQDQGGHLLG